MHAHPALGRHRAGAGWRPLTQTLRSSCALVGLSVASCNVRTPAVVSAPAASVTSASRATSKYAAHAVPLSRDNDYFRGARAPDFWTLVPYYVGQPDAVSCSLASLTMLVNSARHAWPLSSEHPLVTPSLLQERIRSPAWDEGLAPGGQGVTLDQLAELTTLSLRAFGVAHARVEATHVPDPSAAALSRLRQRLSASEASASDWVVLNFFAGAYVGTGDYGHIAPVAAFDAVRKRVLVLDPDRTWYEPYWIPDEVALVGMATPDSVTGQPRGYLYVSSCGGEGCAR